jgi:aminoglycoside phosphotransferase family enzyme
MKLSSETVNILNELSNVDAKTRNQLENEARERLRTRYTEEELDQMRKENDEFFEKLNRIADERNQTVEKI